MSALLSYGALKVVWWAILVVILIFFCVMGGGDIGVGVLLPLIGRNDTERRVALNAIGPTWEANQTWFILLGGALFAAWPELYAAAFSGLYLAMMLVLWTMFLRPVCFDYRNKIRAPIWRYTWDWILCVCCIAASIFGGTAIGNVFLGLPFRFTDSHLNFQYTGDFFTLLRPYALCMAVFLLLMFVMQAAAFLTLKASGIVAKRAQRYGLVCGALLLVLFTVLGFWTARLDGFSLAITDISASLTPIMENSVRVIPGHWLHNYSTYPWMMAAPILGYVCLILFLWTSYYSYSRLAFLSSVFAIWSFGFTAAFTLFPFIFPSVTYPRHSLTLWNACSSQHTLFVMLLIAIVMLPIILMYTAWINWVMRGRVGEEDIKKNDIFMY